MRSSYACARASIMASLAWGAWAGCGDGATAGEGRANANIDDFQVSAYTRTGDAGVADAALAAPAADAGTPLSDEQIVGVLGAIEESEALLALAALARGSDPNVQQFAADALQTVRDAQGRALALGIVPAPSAQAGTYAAGGVTLAGTLQTQDPGKSFDRAYVESQILYDALAVHLIETDLLPEAGDPGLRAELATAHDELQDHMNAAVGLRADVRPSDAGLPASDAGEGEPAGPAL